MGCFVSLYKIIGNIPFDFFEVYLHFSILVGKIMLLAITCEHEAVNDVIPNMLLRFSSLFFYKQSKL